ncbi:MAG: hypothetical protein M5U34_13085 [Chloroflexi bacterium]|nr:hypothetical protein [Chloroflexota bacterium]
MQLDISERTWMEVTIDGDVVLAAGRGGDDPPMNGRRRKKPKSIPATAPASSSPSTNSPGAAWVNAAKTKKKCGELQVKL